MPVKTTFKPHPTTKVTSRLLGSAPRDPAVARHIAPQWVGHYRILLALRRRLADDRAEELAELASPLEPHSMNQADTASDEFDHALLLSELSAVQDRMFEVDEALRRIESGTYGICELTGRPIPADRLRAVPWTRFSSEAAEHLEQQAAIGRAHLGELGSVRRPRRATLAPAEPAVDDQEPSASERSTSDARSDEDWESEPDDQQFEISPQKTEGL